MKIILSIKEIIVNYVNLKYPLKYNFSNCHQIYKLDTIVSELLYVLKTGISWRDYRGPIKYESLYYHFKFFRDNNIFINVYKQLADTYFSKNKTTKLKYQLVDSSFIQNMYGTNLIGRNKFYKNKKGTKISFITDSKGIPLSILFKCGNVNDSKFIEEHLNNMLILTNTNKYKSSNKHKQYILGDKGYDTKNIRKLFSDIGYNVIIDYNKRNTKNKLLIKKLTKKEKILYRKRIVIENIFCYLKKNRRINLRYDKKFSSFKCFIYLALCKFIYSRIGS